MSTASTRPRKIALGSPRKANTAPANCVLRPHFSDELGILANYQQMLDVPYG
jgi:hypothetical protein